MSFIGVIRRRPKGGLSDWIGENEICEAKKAIIFKALPPPKDFYDKLKVKIAYKRFYSDGTATSKFELGINLTLKSQDEYFNIKVFVDYLCKLIVKIRNPDGDDVECNLLDSGKYLAKLYYYSSTETKAWFKFENHYVKSEKPLLCLSKHQYHQYIFPDLIELKKINNPFNRVKDIYIYDVPYKNSNLNLYVINSKYPNEKLNRKIRIILTRLYVNQVCLARILQYIWGRKINIIEGSRQSDNLQFYLNLSLKRINKEKNTLVKESADRDLLDSLDLIHARIEPGRREALISEIDRINIRPNIKKKIINYITNYNSYEDLIMGDKFENISNSTVINRSSLKNAMNTMANASKGIEDALEEVSEYIEQTGNEDLIKLFDSLTGEISKETDNKIVLSTIWEKIVKMLPDTVKIATAVAAISKFFS